MLDPGHPLSSAGVDPERPWIKTETVKSSGLSTQGTILERLNALESHIPRLDKAIVVLTERIEELVRLLGA